MVEVNFLCTHKYWCYLSSLIPALQATQKLAMTILVFAFPQPKQSPHPDHMNNTRLSFSKTEARGLYPHEPWVLLSLPGVRSARVALCNFGELALRPIAFGFRSNPYRWVDQRRTNFQIEFFVLSSDTTHNPHTRKTSELNKIKKTGPPIRKN